MKGSMTKEVIQRDIITNSLTKIKLTLLYFFNLGETAKNQENIEIEDEAELENSNIDEQNLDSVGAIKRGRF